VNRDVRDMCVSVALQACDRRLAPHHACCHNYALSVSFAQLAMRPEVPAAERSVACVFSAGRRVRVCCGCVFGCVYGGRTGG
jgi:hypothetical protein